MFNVSFNGIKENIAYGKQAIAKVEQDFPEGFKSSTHYATFSDTIDKKVLREYTDAVNETRDRVHYLERLGERRKDAVEIAVKLCGGANCGEQALLVSKRLDEQGIKNKLVNMNVCYKTQNSTYITGGHSFCVLDMDENSKVDNPKTWGKDAVVVDMWSNTVAKADEAIKFFNTFVKKGKGEEIHFQTCLDI